MGASTDGEIGYNNSDDPKSVGTPSPADTTLQPDNAMPRRLSDFQVFGKNGFEICPVSEYLFLRRVHRASNLKIFVTFRLSPTNC